MSCAGRRTRASIQDWSVETYSLRHERNELALPVRWMEAFQPGEGMGGAANHWNGRDVALGGLRPDDPNALRIEIRQKHHPRRHAVARLGGYLRGAGAVLRSVREVVRHLWQSRQHPGTDPAGREPVRRPASERVPTTTARDNRRRDDLQNRRRVDGPQTLPAAGGEFSGAYTNPDGQKLGQCQYCGHCERFICEAQAKASPAVLLYPMLLKRKGFEIRLRCHVLGLPLRQAGEASHRRALCRPHHWRGIRAAGRSRGAGRVHHVQYQVAAHSAASGGPTIR